MKEIITIRVDPKTKEKLEEMARAMDRTKSYIAAEAIRDYIQLNEWQIQAIQEGINQADKGEMIYHDKIRKKWEKKGENSVD
ncbi:MAG: CopG family ribbon-helix-helix protein [Candidatus Aminicenantes bacterium]|nr:CopG family ribbon-helix-helix protein [Candidatus Aminicenantes bacterium]